MPSIDLHIPTLLFILPASRAGLLERMLNILGILREPLLCNTDPIDLLFMRSHVPRADLQYFID